MLSSDLIFAMFGSKDPLTRSLAIKYGHLHITMGKQYSELIRLGLQDSDADVRKDAFQKMEMVIGFLDLDAMIRNESNAALRNAAISFLTENIEKNELLLLKFLDDLDPDVILFAIQIISKNPTEELVKACKQYLYSLDVNITQAAIEVMVKAGEKSVIPVLNKLLTQNIWMELVILDALVKLGDQQVYTLINERMKPDQETSLVVFEVMNSNPSLTFLKLLKHHSGSFINSQIGINYLQTFADVSLNVKTDVMELDRFYFEFKKNRFPVRSKMNKPDLTEKELLGLGILILWEELDGSDWNATEWLKLILVYDNQMFLTNLISETHWQKLLEYLSAEPFSISVFDLLIHRRPGKVESYLRLHPENMKTQIDSILQRMNEINLLLPDFLFEIVESEMKTINLPVLKESLRQNPSLVQFRKKILTLPSMDDELMELIFDSLSCFDQIPEELINQVCDYINSSDFQKRQISVKGAFLCGQNIDREKLVQLINDPVLEVRIKAYQFALEFKRFDLIDDLNFNPFTDPLEIFYIARWIGNSDHEKADSMLSKMTETTAGTLKEQIEKLREDRVH